MTAPSTYQWFKSSSSGGSGTERVECAHGGDRTLVRDSKREGGPLVGVKVSAWQAFTHALKRGELDARWLAVVLSTVARALRTSVSDRAIVGPNRLVHRASW